MRFDGRKKTELRPVVITPNCSDYAEGSAMVEFGRTKIICTASFEANTPSWLKGSGSGWVTAEYGMLPRATHTRVRREKNASSGRTQEISRLIGRSLRAAVDLRKLGEKQLTIDCDVLHADGGTRTAAITGGFVAMALAFKKLRDVSEIREFPITQYVSAVSVGLQNGEPLLDLNYDEDSGIGTDMNFVMTSAGTFVEVQGTAEHIPFSKEQLLQMMDVASLGCQELFAQQAKVMGHLLSLPNRT